MESITESEARKLGLDVPRRTRKASAKQMSQEAFYAACRAWGLPEPMPEFQFHPARKWRVDWMFPGQVGMEIQGGLFVQGRHTQGAALLKEYEKINELACMGYRVLFVTPKQVDSGEAFGLVKRALES